MIFLKNLEKTFYTYNICDHKECYDEVGSQAISYTTGVPAMIGAMLMLQKKWFKPGKRKNCDFHKKMVLL